VFQLGTCAFTLKDCDAATVSAIEELIPTLACYGAAGRTNVLAVCGDVREILNRIKQFHMEAITIDGSCVTSPAEKRVLIAGPSFAGKTTLAMGLVLGRSWRVVAESATLIDIVQDTLIPFAAPFCIRTGTAIRVKESTNGKEILPVLNSWLPTKDLSVTKATEASFDLAIYLGEFIAGTDEPLHYAPISTTQYLKKLLAGSNIVRIPSAIEKMHSYLDDAACFTLAGGTLQERIEFVINCVDEKK